MFFPTEKTGCLFKICIEKRPFKCVIVYLAVIQRMCTYCMYMRMYVCICVPQMPTIVEYKLAPITKYSL